MNITIKDIKKYIEELKLQRDIIKEFKDKTLWSNAELQIAWFDKQIERFEQKIKEVEDGI